MNLLGLAHLRAWVSCAETKGANPPASRESVFRLERNRSGRNDSAQILCCWSPAGPTNRDTTGKESLSVLWQ
ncbi:hypothetical protein scyTo_0010152 [Scyliorhinus torazame]|uniref:Uncharacterized protein n=1 Tax=Scyliorhinus torazame TaxID=75743 RepID=A0A401P142_SCYTO|nr:hypothetical protein [Scyliorhinus torazame]